MNNHIPITLVGFGIAGQILLSYILDLVPGYKVRIIDPDFLGGDLIRHYSGIFSNTTIGQKLESISKLPGNWSDTISSLKTRGNLDNTIQLSDLVFDMRKSSGKLSIQCECIYDKVIRVSWNEEMRIWNLYLQSGVESTTNILCFCGGMSPRQNDYGIPIIPLAIAIDKVHLSHIIKKGQSVLVIGSAHSATLVLKNLNNIPDIKATCIYRGSNPFKYARDNEYGGIKKESADIADAIKSGVYTNLSLVNAIDLPNISKALRDADWVIQATGFVGRFPEIFIGNTRITPTWDSITGIAKELPQVQAFGACLPSTTCINEIVYPDISLGSFVEQIEKRWPLLKLTIQNQNLV